MLFLTTKYSHFSQYTAIFGGNSAAAACCYCSRCFTNNSGDQFRIRKIGVDGGDRQNNLNALNQQKTQLRTLTMLCILAFINIGSTFQRSGEAELVIEARRKIHRPNEDDFGKPKSKMGNM
uniref:Uncharacterized protein n=1 Tax=Glossina austeni TaxID=7395 RepID=A0A1A9UX01_GLOAU